MTPSFVMKFNYISSDFSDMQILLIEI